MLSLVDTLGYPVTTVQIPVTATVDVRGDDVIVSIPEICFQCGQLSADDPVPPGEIPAAGYLYTISGYLPQNLCPPSLSYVSVYQPTDNGFVQPSAFTGPPGYILSISNSGGLVVWGATQYNLIPQGSQLLRPVTITYKTSAVLSPYANTALSTGPTNITQFPFPNIFDSIRDSHVNDTFGNLIACAWADNSAQPDKTNGTCDVWLWLGTSSSSGVPVPNVGYPRNLTQYSQPGINVFDTAIAISRTTPGSLVVTWGYGDSTTLPGTRTQLQYFSTTSDGGATWTTGAPLTGTNVTNCVCGDNRGVLADAYGNYWCSYTNLAPPLSAYPAGLLPVLALSVDNGFTWTTQFAGAPLGPANLPGVFNPADSYDFPQICVGGGPDPYTGVNVYGLWMMSGYLAFIGVYIPTRTFIPITGLGTFGVPSTVFMNALTDTQIAQVPAASTDGKLFTLGGNIAAWNQYLEPFLLTFTSPGPTYATGAPYFDQNVAGPFSVGMLQLLPSSVALPGKGFFPTAQGLAYDNSRACLYAAVSSAYPEYSGTQDMRLSLIFSRNNGGTWSNPIAVSGTDQGNRGFASLALGDAGLVVTWYDGRGDTTYQSLQYFITIITPAQLDAWVLPTVAVDTLYLVASQGDPAPDE